MVVSGVCRGVSGVSGNYSRGQKKSYCFRFVPCRAYGTETIPRRCCTLFHIVQCMQCWASHISHLATVECPTGGYCERNLPAALQYKVFIQPQAATCWGGGDTCLVSAAIPRQGGGANAILDSSFIRKIAKLILGTFHFVWFARIFSTPHTFVAT